MKKFLTLISAILFLAPNANAENEKKENKVYRRKEISEYSSRSFYVGEDVSKEDIKAKYENGINLSDFSGCYFIAFRNTCQKPIQ